MAAMAPCLRLAPTFAEVMTHRAPHRRDCALPPAVARHRHGPRRSRLPIPRPGIREFCVECCARSRSRRRTLSSASEWRMSSSELRCRKKRRRSLRLRIAPQPCATRSRASPLSWRMRSRQAWQVVVGQLTCSVKLPRKVPRPDSSPSSCEPVKTRPGWLKGTCASPRKRLCSGDKKVKWNRRPSRRRRWNCRSVNMNCVFRPSVTFATRMPR
mmetsp:Transcript_8879/g.18908  ORF Transcript_8879/g.18908 Transcript_8879/m.18908 type:complete len:213 (+) Transcript_8879:8-646(+)